MLIYFLYKSIRRVKSFFKHFSDRLFSKYEFQGNKVSYNKFRTIGVPSIMVARGGKCVIGDDFAMNNGVKGNPLTCIFFVDKGALLQIGQNVGLTQTVLRCHHQITIGDNVKIGRGTEIYDTDFHAIDPKIRNSQADFKNKIKKSVTIENNVFIGAYSIVLKGVTIGENSVVGAGSILTKSIPSNQIWAGNPAKFIRNL